MCYHVKDPDFQAAVCVCVCVFVCSVCVCVCVSVHAAIGAHEEKAALSTSARLQLSSHSLAGNPDISAV